MQAEKISSYIENDDGYRTGFNVMMRVVMLQAVIIFCMTGFVYYYISNVVSQDRYYALTSEGQRMQMSGLETPNMNISAILAWAEKAATDVLTFGFNDVDARFEKSVEYFTPEGWLSFRDAVILSKAVQTIVENQQIITSIQREPPTLLYQGMSKGDYTWIVRVPVIMTIRAGNTSSIKKISVNLEIIRMPTTQNPMGIGINRWIS